MERLKHVADAGYASIICDGFTDVAVQEQELMYVRTCRGGLVSVDFLGIVSTSTPEAKGITNNIGRGVQVGLDKTMQDFLRKISSDHSISHNSMKSTASFWVL